MSYTREDLDTLLYGSAGVFYNGPPNAVKLLLKGPVLYQGTFWHKPRIQVAGSCFAVLVSN